MKTCERCQNKYSNISNRQKYCFDCIPVIAREYSKRWQKRWRKNNLERAREKDRKNRIRYKDKRNKYSREYYKKHKDTEVYKKRINKWWKKHPNKKKEYNKKYFQLHKKELLIQRRGYQKVWRRKNKGRLNFFVRKKLKTDPKFHLNRIVSKAIWEALKEKKAGRKWESLVDYSLEDLIKHLEKQFTPEINWRNFGKYWQIDHKRPKSWFGFTPEEFKKCWSLKNLQPLEKYKNLSKNNHYAS